MRNACRIPRFSRAAVIFASLWGPATGAQVCGSFRVVPTPDPGVPPNTLRRVAAAAEDDAWALGASGPSTAPFLLHWNGAAWNETPLPAVPSGTTFEALGATPDGDTWLGAEGPRMVPTGTGNPVLARARNGTFNRVDEVSLPPQTVYPYWPRGGRPTAIDGTSTTDVWVALQALGNGDGGGTIIPSVLHFDGSSWTETQLPRRSNIRSHPRGIEAISPSDVWVAGYGRSNATPFFGEVFHYDGSSWSYIPTPLEDTPQVFFEGVSASGPSDVWIIGNVNYTEPVYLHFDGVGWTVVSGPATAPASSVLALSPTEAWALPWVSDDPGYYLHWDGSAWLEVPGEIPGSEGVTRVAFGRAGPCDAWSVGHVVSGGVRHTLAERLTPATTGVPDVNIEGLHLSLAPNPAAGTAVVRYAIPSSAMVRVDVQDLLGRTVAVLAEGPAPAGHGEARWEAAGRPGGIYLVRLQAGGTTRVARLTLTR